MSGSEKHDLAEQKKAARAAASKARAAAHQRLAETAGLALARNGLPCDHRMGRRVASGFQPYKSEISVLPLMAKLAAEGWMIAMPVVVAKGEPLVFRAWEPGAEMVPGLWEIPVPPETAEEVEPDLLLIPMLAFDRLGYRLGYGGGFYDRTLELLRNRKPITAIGVAYAAQEMSEVPRGPHDQPLDWIMTEEQTFRPARS